MPSSVYDDVDPLAWDQQVAFGNILDPSGADVPIWPKWRAARLRQKYREDYGDLTVAQSALLERAITLQIMCEWADALLRAGRAIDSEDYNRNVRGLRSVLADLGLERKVSATAKTAKEARAERAKPTLVVSNELTWAN